MNLIQKKKKVIGEAIMKGEFPGLVAKLEAVLANNKDNTQYSVGNSRTIADLKIYSVAKAFNHPRLNFIPSGFIDNYPRIKQVAESVANEPKIKQYYASHQN